MADVDLVGGRIVLRRAADTTKRDATKTTKTGASRPIDIDAATVEVLRKWKATRGAVALDFGRPEA